jgi:hypothetical protein
MVVLPFLAWSLPTYKTCDLWPKNIFAFLKKSSAIDHRTWKTGLPVRSAVLKPCAGRLVVGWVTTSEYLLLIVFANSFLVESRSFATDGYANQLVSGGTIG